MKLFVYGSLREGKGLNYLLKDSTFLGQYKTQGEFYMFGLKSGAFPYVTDEQLDESCQPTKIIGEVYEVPDALIEELDDIENHPDHYTRSEVVLEDFDHEVEMYLLLNPITKASIRKHFNHRFIPINNGDFCRIF